MAKHAKKGVSQSLEAIILVVVALSIVAVYAGWAFGVFGRAVNTPILTVVGTPVIQGASSNNPTLYITIKNTGAVTANITTIYVNNQVFTPKNGFVLIPAGSAETLVLLLSNLRLNVGSQVSVVVSAGQTSLSTIAIVES
ncbi:hypothetical protein B9P99_03735 [Candidatus Marsarchaeota G1 archaeon OSP_B]|jgi:hypothetical protein|uniref:DUF4352 domain-containing protein n=5 Tax=Candidatus Marsarchaeota TaxID=1978152 RepID=A0A2R6AKP0_9ARCH|nr:MAG: hypothetical protein B9Q01_00570 [Candidatus Marsarchaeota G1 archaeon OSP_D]PSN86938.1 MAG: hypothetical protein B9Q02_00630 [Candidatus Marsarchaeota G1 archaeon BE_D]PSN89600.1 MAG: hypothetical protein B9Q00_01040 [Candidatus Marsarchaeota G1 archaeon OSP_C]PSN91913.1 MAG: hypothetical protein B9P99_03735 [Candidatus Marsarchaeota G1 archaeon OSP_B]PSO02087.1 MAG: hypothetical protein B9Q10_01710 [Candidatus Marsarchaeota G2 archaeon ECH_B_SAG-E12]